MGHSFLLKIDLQTANDEDATDRTRLTASATAAGLHVAQYSFAVSGTTDRNLSTVPGWNNPYYLVARVSSDSTAEINLKIDPAVGTVQSFAIDPGDFMVLPGSYFISADDIYVDMAVGESGSIDIIIIEEA